MALGRGVGAVGGREGVVHIQVAELGQACCGEAGESLASSPAWKRRFSRSSHAAGRQRVHGVLARPQDRCSRRRRRRAAPEARTAGSTTGLQAHFRHPAALGPVEVRQQHHLGAPARSGLRMVGRAARSRVSSLMAPPAPGSPSKGTLKSTRTRARLPWKVAGLIEGLEGHGLEELRHGQGGVGHAGREAPLVVVPAQHPHQGLPSITWVCGRATVDELAMWLKSLDTSGSSV